MTKKTEIQWYLPVLLREHYGHEEKGLRIAQRLSEDAGIALNTAKRLLRQPMPMMLSIRVLAPLAALLGVELRDLFLQPDGDDAN